VVPRSLQEDLLRIPGVEGAEVEGTGEQPAGLRIRIAAGADQSAVGSAIRRVLTEHGLGTDTRLPGEGSQGDPSGPEVVPVPSSAEVADDPQVEAEAVAEDGAVAVLDEVGPTASVIDLTEEGGSPQEGAPAEASADPEPEAIPEFSSEAHPEAASPEAAEPATEVDSEPVEVPIDQALVPVPTSPESVPPPIDPVAPAHGVTPERLDRVGGLARIESVGVEEGRDGILVTVASSDGESVRQIASSTEGGVDAAVVKATARLADPEAPDPIVVDIEERRIKGVDIVMIVLDADGTITAGSSVVAAGRSFALGRATWAALSL